MSRPRPDLIERRNFAHEQFLWLRQVASDPTLPPLATRVAIALTKFFNRDTHLAYPAHGTLAAELGVTDRAIRATISKMIEHGHLDVVGNRRGGRRHTNRYRLLLKTPKGGTPVPGFGQERRKGRVKKAEEICAKGGTNVPPNLLSEPNLEPSGTDLVKMDARTWLSKASLRDGQSVRIFAYECFKRAPDGSLVIDTQADKFRRYNVGKRMDDAEWWSLWEKWCRHAVDYWRRSK